MDDGYVLVIGSAGIDIKGRAYDDLHWGVANPGIVRNSVGGVARNIAENLARLEVETVLLSAVGDDAEGRRVLEKTRLTGVNCEHVRIIDGAHTGVYMALLKDDGNLHVAISDFEVVDSVDPDYLRQHETLFANATMIVIDATLTVETLEVLFTLAERYALRVCADPTNPAVANRLCKYLDRLFLIAPNAAEMVALCGIEDPAKDRETAVRAARQLVASGVAIAVVTLGADGLVYADGSGSGYIRAVKTDVVDTTGAGDALTGAVIFGLLNAVPLDEAMRLGVTAAALTLQTKATVYPKLSQELLYDALMA